MKNCRVILKILALIIICTFTMVPNISYAGFWSDVFTNGRNFIELGKNHLDDPNSIIAQNAKDATTQEIVNDLYSILMPLGVGTTVIVGGILGIKFMLASTDGKAKIKESMIPYVVGCIVIYGAFGIWRIAIEIFSQL